MSEALALPSEVNRLVQRVWLAVDSTPRALRAVGIAASMAQLLQAELNTLFVENEDLLRLAALPSAVETSWLSGTVRPLLPGELARTLRAQAAAIERELVAVAGASGIRWSFARTRGRTLQEALARAAPDELVMLLGSGVVASAGAREGRPRPVPARVLAGDVLAIFDASAAALRALAIARDVAVHHRLALRVLTGPVPDVRAQVTALLHRLDGEHLAWQFASTDSLGEIDAARLGKMALVAMPRPTEAAGLARVRGILERTSGPVLLT
jgi:hypothetical protein